MKIAEPAEIDHRPDGIRDVDPGPGTAHRHARQVERPGHPAHLQPRRLRAERPVSVQVGAAYFNHAAQCSGGLWDVGSATLPVGVHYAPCSVKLNGSSISGPVTSPRPAPSAVRVEARVRAVPRRPVAAFRHLGQEGHQHLRLELKFLGVIYARFGEISLSGSNSKFFCGIYGNTVSMSGSNLTLRGSNCGRPIRRSPACCSSRASSCRSPPIRRRRCPVATSPTTSRSPTTARC